MRYKFNIKKNWQFALLGLWLLFIFKFKNTTEWFSVLNIIILTAAAFAIYMFVKPKWFNNKIGKNGIPASATILEVSETGWYDHAYNPKVKLILEVMPPNGAPYRATYSDFFSKLELHKLQPGNVIRIKYDPTKPQNIIMDDGSSSAANYEQIFEQKMSGNGSIAGMNNTRQTVNLTSNNGNGFDEEAVAELKKFGDLQAELLMSGTEALATIIKSWNTGIMVNEINPMMGFELEVEPSGKPSFIATVKAPVLVQNLDKFQPGRTVKVRYDSYNPERIALAGSV